MTTSYVYKWTHIPTMKWYIGSRTSKKSHVNDGYICSSKIVKPLIVEKSIEWKREIIQTGDSLEMRELEVEILSLLDAKNDPRSFNRHNGDGLFNNDGHNKGKKTVNKNGLYKRVHISLLDEYISTGWILGTPANVKQKISASTTGINKPGHKNGGAKKGSIPWNKGRKETRTEVLKKQSLSHVGKTYSKEIKHKGEIQ